METFEQSFVRSMLRNNHEALHLGNYKEVARRLKAVNPAVDADEALRYARGVTSKIDQPLLMSAAVRLLIEHRSPLMALLEEQGDHGAASYLASIMAKVEGAGTSRPSRAPVADLVFRNWRKPFASVARTMPTGVYQLFRRYKPRAQESHEDGGSDLSLADTEARDIIICELLYLDSEAMECALVTSEGNLYWGTCYINHNMTLYLLLQRPNLRSDEHGISQRLYAVNVKPSGGKRLTVYSCLYIKTGDISERPLSGECLCSFIPDVEHGMLWARMRQIFEGPWKEVELAADDPVMSYISGYDEDEPGAACRIEHFPLIQDMTQPNKHELVLFREPSRALDSLVLTSRARRFPLPVFQRTPKHTNDGKHASEGSRPNAGE